jgi:hypothetical protein
MRNVGSKEAGFSTARDHVEACKCKAFPDKTRITRSINSRAAREIVEAFCIDKGGANIVSKATVSLSDIETSFVRFECATFFESLQTK